MQFIEFFTTYSDVITGVCNIFTALGTVGTVIVALWISLRDNKAKLNVFATVGVLIPDMNEILWLSCVNVGKQPITCNGFAIAPRKSKAPRIMPIRRIDELSTATPVKLNYSEKLDQHFDKAFFKDKTLFKFLGKNKWLAKMKLKYFWRVVANTNVGTFYGKLSNELINEILSSQFPNYENSSS